eukprot:5208161-Prymnesium_polylepis.1
MSSYGPCDMPYDPSLDTLHTYSNTHTSWCRCPPLRSHGAAAPLGLARATQTGMQVQADGLACDASVVNVPDNSIAVGRGQSACSTAVESS